MNIEEREWLLHHLKTHSGDFNMSNGFNNPYATTDPISLEDLILTGQSQYVDVATRPYVGAEWEWSYKDPEEFEYSVDSLGLAPWYEQWMMSKLPGTRYDYSGLNAPITQAMSKVFGDKKAGSVEIPGHITAVPDLVLEGIQELGDLEADYYAKNPAVGGWFTSTDKADPILSELGLKYEYDPAAFIDIFDPESIAKTLSEIKGLEGDAAYKGATVEALTPEMLEKTESQYYTPYEEAGAVELVEELGKNIAGAETGGFAGSGGRKAGLSAAERMYSSGYGDILADIMKMKGKATEDVLDTIFSWQELMG